MIGPSPVTILLSQDSSGLYTGGGGTYGGAHCAAIAQSDHTDHGSSGGGGDQAHTVQEQRVRCLLSKYEGNIHVLVFKLNYRSNCNF